MTASRLVSILRNPRFWFAIILVILAVYLNKFASDSIDKYFTNRPIVPDLFFDITPYVGWAQYAADTIVILAPLIVAWQVVTKRTNEIAYVIIVFAVAEILRAILLVFTPLGGALGNTMAYGFFARTDHGQFPSGHTIVTTLSFFLIDGQQKAWLKGFMLLLVVLEAASLVLSRGHYSIDIIGGLLIAYLCYKEMPRYAKKLEV